MRAFARRFLVSCVPVRGMAVGLVAAAADETERGRLDVILAGLVFGG
jgi:hypothetical protein